ncbi:hypothetical protein G9A89_011598 [Geosiphon pyriformis]|nr:hypothetical protein G9A89_011598 [Geosiphon pyriformis]
MTEHSIEDSLPGGIPAIKLRKKLTKLWFQEAMDKTITIKSLSLSTATRFEHQVMGLLFNPTPEINKSKSGRIRKHKSKLFRIRKIFILTLLSTLGLNHNHISAESAFNFYINKRIVYLLGTLINIELARKAFYSKEKLQTPAVTSKRIQPPTWKKTRVEFPTNLLYHYTLGSTINITFTSASTSNMTSAFGRFPFQNFGISDLWEVTESEEEEEEKSEDQEFTYQNPIPENPEFEISND